MSSSNPDTLGKKKILFLCTSNSCRSQMAEVIVVLPAAGVRLPLPRENPL